MTTTETMPRLASKTIDDLTRARAADFVRFVALQASYGTTDRHAHSKAMRNFSLKHPRSISLPLFEKAAESPGTTLDSAFASPLSPLRPLSDAFLTLLRPQTLLGRIPGIRQVPFMTAVPKQTAGGAYAWIGEGAATPATKSDFATVSLGRAKAGGLVVLTDELVRLSTSSAVAVMQRELIAGCAQFLDTQFVDPAVAAVVNVSPGSITNGAATTASAGTSQANAAADFQSLVSGFIADNPAVEDLVILSSPANAVALSRALNQPSLGLKGGSAFGIPWVTSGAVGALLIALDASQILMADEGDVEIDTSISATVQMNSTPANPPLSSTVLVSLFQLNMTGLKLVRSINWVRAASTAVRYISGAAYV